VVKLFPSNEGSAVTANESSIVESPAALDSKFPPAQAHRDARADEGGEWLTCAVIFGILGGCLALWFGDLSLVTGSLAALLSGLAGVLFSEV
jgi:hypothetical protein